MVVQIFTQVSAQSRPGDIGKEVFFDHSLLFSCGISKDQLVSLQNFPRISKIGWKNIQRLYFWRCNVNVGIFSFLSPLKLRDRIQYLAPDGSEKNREIKLQSPTYWILGKEESPRRGNAMVWYHHHQLVKIRLGM